MGLLCCLMGRQLLAGLESLHCLRRTGICPREQGHPSSCPRTPGVHSCEPPFISFQGLAFRHLLPSRPEAKRVAGRADVQDVAALPPCPLAGGGAARRLRRAMGAEAASCLTHPTPSSSAQGGLTWVGARQSPGPEMAAPHTSPAKPSIALRSRN